jgi:hypothetical protein
MRRTILFAVLAILAVAGFVYSQKARVQTVGRTEDGGFLLNKAGVSGRRERTSLFLHCPCLTCSLRMGECWRF